MFKRDAFLGRVTKSISDNEVRQAYNASHPSANQVTAPQSSGPYVRDVLVDESAVIVDLNNRIYKVPYSILADGSITFDDAAMVEVQQEWLERRAGDTFLGGRGTGNIEKMWSDEVTGGKKS